MTPEHRDRLTTGVAQDHVSRPTTASHDHVCRVPWDAGVRAVSKFASSALERVSAGDDCEQGCHAAGRREQGCANLRTREVAIGS